MTAWDDLRALFPDNTDGDIGADDMRTQVTDLETLDALNAKLASPTFTGVPAAPTAAAATNTTQLATTAFVTTEDNLKAPLASPVFTGTVEIPATSIGAGANYTQFEADGTLVQFGTATTWEDIQSPIDASKVSGGGTVLAYDYDENVLGFLVGGDIADEDKRIMTSVQYPHKAIVDGNLHLHIHWEQTSSDATPIIWTSQYRIQSNGSLHQASWSTPVAVSSTLASGANAYAYTSGTLNQITELAEIDMTGASISAVVQVRVARTDAVAVTINGTMIDFHYEADTLGSDSEYVK